MTERGLLLTLSHEVTHAEQNGPQILGQNINISNVSRGRSLRVPCETDLVFWNASSYESKILFLY
jgi:hypothetical protein